MLLFFHRLKCGRYGRFYGSVDALTITTSILQFMDERRKESVRYRQPDTAAPAITTPSSSGITYEEYLRLKEQKQQQCHKKAELSPRAPSLWLLSVKRLSRIRSRLKGTADL